MKRFENDRSPVKLFSLLKIPMMLFGLGAALVLTPACRAQSEISPDHFDGTDSWEWAAHHSAAHKPKLVPTARQARSAKSDSPLTFQLAAARDLAKPFSHDTVAIQDKRKTAARKPNKQ